MHSLAAEELHHRYWDFVRKIQILISMLHVYLLFFLIILFKEITENTLEGVKGVSC